MRLTRELMQKTIADAKGMPGIVQGPLLLMVNLIGDRELEHISQIVGGTLDAVKRGDIDALRALLEAAGIPRDQIYPDGANAR